MMYVKMFVTNVFGTRCFRAIGHELVTVKCCEYFSLSKGGVYIEELVENMVCNRPGGATCGFAMSLLGQTACHDVRQLS